MSNALINVDLLKKVNSFLKRSNSLNYLDSNIFESIDSYKEISDIDFNNYYLEYITNTPKLDFETTIKISREVYQIFGKEKEFDSILEGLINSNSIDYGSLNKDDNNCITKASESRVLLSGTYYDVILLCHEIGHKLKPNNYMIQSDIMDNFFFETPSVIIELAANDYLRDNYDVDIAADELRKKHVLSIHRDDSVEKNVFLSIIKLLKERKLNALNLYKIFVKNNEITEYLDMLDCSIEDCFGEGMCAYSYDIGYIIGNHIRSCNDKTEILDEILNYKYNGIREPYTIDSEIIRGAFGQQKYVM